MVVTKSQDTDYFTLKNHFQGQNLVNEIKRLYA